MNTLKVAGKFLDQPVLVAKFQRAVPALLTTGAAVYGIKQVNHAPEHKKEKSRHPNSSNNGIYSSISACSPKNYRQNF